jgi:hypothetical protein
MQRLPARHLPFCRRPVPLGGGGSLGVRTERSQRVQRDAHFLEPPGTVQGWLLRHRTAIRRILDTSRTLRHRYGARSRVKPVQTADHRDHHARPGLVAAAGDRLVCDFVCWVVNVADGSRAGLRDPDLDAADLPVEAGPPDSGRPGRPGPGQKLPPASVFSAVASYRRGAEADFQAPIVAPSVASLRDRASGGAVDRLAGRAFEHIDRPALA